MEWIIEKFDLISGASQITTTGAALVALVIAYTQLRQNRRIHRESTAKAIYKEYLRIAVEHPHLAYPRSGHIESIRNTEEYVRYTWFVSYMLFACDEVLALSRETRQWRGVIKEQVKFHLNYLSSPEFYETNEHSGYSLEMQKILDEVKRAHNMPIHPTHIVSE